MILRHLILVGISCMSLGWLFRRKIRGAGAGRTISKAKAAKVIYPGGSLKPHDKDEIGIASFNILADQFSGSKRLLQYVHKDWLAWEHRKPLIVSEISRIEACITCLQEVDACHWEAILSDLEGYEGLLQEKKGGVDNAAPLCAILFKPDRLQMLWNESRSRSLLAAFRFTDTLGVDQTLFVINVHLEGSPYRPNDRVSQIRSSLQRLQQCQMNMALDPRECLVIVAGDFNSGRSESAWRLMIRGRLEGGWTEAHLPNVEVCKTTVSHPYFFQDAYLVADLDLPFTRKVPTLGSTLDHIFVTTDFDVPVVYNPLLLRSTQEEQLNKLSFPDQYHPSDHLPIGAIIRLRQPSPAARRLYNAQADQEEANHEED